jgi:hypothetical protein
MAPAAGLAESPSEETGLPSAIPKIKKALG